MNVTRRNQFCPNDGFPLIEVYGATVCSVEHADATIGGQQVEDARIHDGYLHLILANGASIPLTCPCCGGRIHLRDMPLERLSELLTGRIVEGFRHGEWVSQHDAEDRHPIFAIQFSGEEDVSARTIQVHLSSVERIFEYQTSEHVRSDLH